MSEKKKDDIEGVSPEELREYKDKLIAETYYNEEKGYKSKEKTYKMAREKNALITRKDVEDWFSRNGVALKPRSFKNSYIAGYPMQEYQMDLFQMNKKSGIKDWAKLCMIMVDIFTKRTEIVPVEGKDASDLKKGIKELLRKFGGEPSVLYTDQEPALKRKEITEYMDKRDIHLIMTATHASVAERQSRTFKRMIVERLRERPEAERKYHDGAFLDKLTNIYNHEVHRTTGMTPAQAAHPGNWKKVRTQLELHRLPVHHYPRLDVGDYVRKLLKKQPFAKESEPNWSKKIYRIEKIDTERIFTMTGHVLYKLAKDEPGSKPEYLQHELLLVKKGSTTGEPGASSSG